MMTISYEEEEDDEDDNHDVMMIQNSHFRYVVLSVIVEGVNNWLILSLYTPAINNPVVAQIGS